LEDCESGAIEIQGDSAYGWGAIILSIALMGGGARNLEFLTECIDGSIAITVGNDTAYLNFRGGNHLNIYACIGEGFEHLGGDTRSANHPRADDAHLGNIARYQDAIEIDVRIVVKGGRDGFSDRLGTVGILFVDGKSNVIGIAFVDRLDDQIYVDIFGG
jgi:hypothetical protein